MQLISVSAIAIAGLLALAFGVRYLIAREFMPYHATVLGKPWAALEPRLQAIILGMLKVAGGGLLGYGLTLLWLLPALWQGEAWAAWAALSISLAVIAPILYTVLWLRRISPGARTPVAPTIATLALVIVGVLAFFASYV